MSDRVRIDWESLRPFPRRKPDGATREDLAERKFRAHKAHHKGRCHVYNWQRRQAKAQAVKDGRKKLVKAIGKSRGYLDAVRAYWRGELDTHP